MSQEAVSWVFKNSRAKGRAVAVLIAIAYYSDEKGENAYPKTSTLARFTGQHRITIWRALRILQEIGEIEILKATKTGQANTYRILKMARAKKSRRCATQQCFTETNSISKRKSQLALWPEGGAVKKEYKEFLALRDEHRIPKSVTWEAWRQMTKDQRKKLQAA